MLMTMSARAGVRAGLLSVALAGLALPMWAQQDGGRPGPPPPRGQHPPPPGAGGRGGDGVLPPGPWWTNNDVIAAIGLTADQRKRIEEMFLQSRMQLSQMHAALEQQELQLQPLLETNPVDQGKALAQIGRIADSRAELEKVNAKMLLEIRSVLSAEQYTKLRATKREDRKERGDRPQGRPERAPGRE